MYDAESSSVETVVNEGPVNRAGVGAVRNRQNIPNSAKVQEVLMETKKDLRQTLFTHVAQQPSGSVANEVAF